MGIIKDLFNFFFCDCDQKESTIINVTIPNSATVVQNSRGIHVNGKLIYRHKNNITLNIYVMEDAHSVNVVTGNVTVGGGVAGSVNVTNGDVDVQLYVNGNARTVNGDIRCGIVKGNATTGNGDINCT